MKTTRYLFLMAVLAVALTACDNNVFKVEGNVEGAADTTKLIVEYAMNDQWVVADTAVTTGNGDFKFAITAPEFPNVYRLRHGQDVIYFPIDSVECLTINTKLKAFGTDYTMEGSKQAETMAKIDKEAIEFATGKRDAAGYEAWKDDIARNVIVKDQESLKSILSYYLITKYVGNKPLFDPTVPKDLKVIGAVANNYKQFLPNDPRTLLLERIFIEAQREARRANNEGVTMAATEVGLFDINLQDKNGQYRSLREVASHGNVVILNFTLLTADFSPMFNKLLNDIYSKHRAQGLEIFQVCFDDNEADWVRAASNLPWIVVRDPNSEASVSLRDYNVNGVPTVFIVGRNGELVERVDNLDDLESRVARQL